MTFEFSYAIEYGFDLDYDDISSTTETLVIAADETTDFNRDAWSLSFQGTEFGVSFPCECCRDRFIEIYERAVRSEPTDDAPAPSTKRARGRSHPACL
jgi:hypothetical protein